MSEDDKYIPKVGERVVAYGEVVDVISDSVRVRWDAPETWAKTVPMAAVAPEAKTDVLMPSWAEDTMGDAPIPEDAQIDAAFPTSSGRHDLYKEAMRLVGAKRSKAGLVSLVNWLLHQAEPKSIDR